MWTEKKYPWDSWNSHPLHELRAFKKVSVPAHSVVEVTVPLTEDMFIYYNTALHKGSFALPNYVKDLLSGKE